MEALDLIDVFSKKSATMYTTTKYASSLGMINILLSILILLIEISVLIILERHDRSWLYAYITANLILVSSLGSKLIPLFGFITNSGNIFYLAVTVAIVLLVERYGRDDAYRGIWIGTSAIFFFLLMTQIVLSKEGTVATRSTDEALALVFDRNLRVGLASVFAFLVAQHINISLFDWLRRKTHGHHLWLRFNVSNIVTQVIDSILFFSIAFLNIIPLPALIVTAAVGCGMKIVAGMLAAPFLSVRLPPPPQKTA